MGESGQPGNALDLPPCSPATDLASMDLPQQLLEKVPRMFGDKGRAYGGCGAAHLLEWPVGLPTAALAAATFVDCILGTSWSLEDEGSLDLAPKLAHAHMLQRFL